MEETKRTPEIAKKCSEETTHHDQEQPDKPLESPPTPPVLVAISWGIIVVGLLALAIMIYDGEVLHVCLYWRRLLFIILLVSGSLSLKAFWNGESLWQTNEHGKKSIKPSVIRGAFKLAIGIAGMAYWTTIESRPGIKMIYAYRYEYVQPTADSPKDYWIEHYESGELYKGMSKEYTYGSGKDSYTERKQEGFGILQWKSGSYYIGMWKEGIRTFGLHVWKGGNTSAYFGTFQWNEETEESEITGRGVYFYDNGYTFDGTFKDGKEDGWGYAHFPDGGQVYIRFKQGKEVERREPAVWQHHYIGWFNKNDTTGYGRYYYPQGGFYQGWFKNGKFNGAGRLADAENHTIAERDWEMADPRGEVERLLKETPAPAAATARQEVRPAATATYSQIPEEDIRPMEAFLTQPDPSARHIIRYKGKLVDQKPEGKAQATFDNGDVYNGEWHKGLREGYGEIKYANGDEYKGEWKADKRTGKGYYFKGPYDYVKGDFVDGKPHGLAIRYVNGVRVYNGRWVEGVPQKTGIRANARGKSE